MSRLFNSLAEVAAHNARIHQQARERRGLEDKVEVSLGWGEKLEVSLLIPVRGGKYPSAIVVGLCREHRILAPYAEVEFHPLRKWKFDLAWAKEKIALEIEGGIWKKGGGAHSHPLNIERDIAKYNAATLLGWRVLRCAPEDLAEGIANVASLMLVTQ